MGNSFNGGPTPNLGHLVDQSYVMTPLPHQPLLYQYNLSDSCIMQAPLSKDWTPALPELIVAIFRCRPKPAPPTEVFQIAADVAREAKIYGDEPGF